MSGPFTHLERVLGANLAEIDSVCLELRQLMKTGSARWSSQAFAVELLAREALTNGVRHGCRQGGAVAFTCRLGTGSAVIKVRDPGPGFDWKAQLERPGDDWASDGRGLAIFRAYATRFHYNSEGNLILLIRVFPESNMPDPSASSDGTNALFHPGDLTAATIGGIRDRLKALLQADPQTLTIDLAGVQMVDSMGIGLMIQAQNSIARTGGSLVVINASSDLLELFRSMRLDKRFTIVA